MFAWFAANVLVALRIELSDDLRGWSGRSPNRPTCGASSITSEWCRHRKRLGTATACQVRTAGVQVRLPSQRARTHRGSTDSGGGAYPFARSEDRTRALRSGFEMRGESIPHPRPTNEGNRRSRSIVPCSPSWSRCRRFGVRGDVRGRGPDGVRFGCRGGLLSTRCGLPRQLERSLELLDCGIDALFWGIEWVFRHLPRPTCKALSVSGASNALRSRRIEP
jgi:hypothetical protein